MVIHAAVVSIWKSGLAWRLIILIPREDMQDELLSQLLLFLDLKTAGLIVETPKEMTLFGVDNELWMGIEQCE